MQDSRRSFLQKSLGLAGATALTSIAHANVLETKSDVELFSYESTVDGAFPIVQLMTNHHATEFGIIFDKIKSYTVTVTDASGMQRFPQRVLSETRSDSPYLLEKYYISDLLLGVDYQLNVTDQATGKVLDSRNFKTIDLSKQKARYAVASCMNDSFSAKVDMWRSMGDAKPEFVFLIGDTCYSDNKNDKSEGGYWRRYCETRSQLGYFRLKNLTPTVAVWDDHDFGDNNANRDFPKKQFTTFLFQSFWEPSQPMEGFEKGLGVSKVLNAFGLRFFLMDSRTFRSEMDPTNGTQWGENQEDSLVDNLHTSTTPAIIMNGSQFFGGYLGKDSFESSHTADFKRFIESLKKVEAPICFASGDVHFSEIMKIEQAQLGYETFEFTSSSIHCFSFPFQQFRAKNPRRLMSTWTHNFMIFETTYVGGLNAIDFNVQSFGKKNKLRFSHAGTVRRTG